MCSIWFHYFDKGRLPLSKDLLSIPSLFVSIKRNKYFSKKRIFFLDFLFYTFLPHFGYISPHFIMHIFAFTHIQFVSNGRGHTSSVIHIPRNGWSSSKTKNFRWCMEQIASHCVYFCFKLSNMCKWALSLYEVYIVCD